jgi:hypothetical protein
MAITMPGGLAAMQKNIIADGMKNEPPATPRNFHAPVIERSKVDGLPGDSYVVALTLAQVKPRRDGSLEGVNALHQWRLHVGAFVQLYQANYKTFDQRRFRRTADWFEREPGGNLAGTD